MIKKVHHIGVAVDNLEEARRFFKENFRLPSGEQESFGEIRFSFVPMEGTDIELLSSRCQPSGSLENMKSGDMSRMGRDRLALFQSYDD